MSRSSNTEAAKMKAHLCQHRRLPEDRTLSYLNTKTPASRTTFSDFRQNYGTKLSAAHRLNDSGYFTPSPNLATVTPESSDKKSCVDNSGINDSCFDDSCLEDLDTTLVDLTQSYPGRTPLLPVVSRRRIASQAALDDAETSVEKPCRQCVRSGPTRHLDRLRTTVPKSKVEEQRRVMDRVPVTIPMRGAKYVDFVMRLQDRNFQNTISRILDGLEPLDLGAVCCVNRQWRAACQADRRNDKRRVEFMKRVRVEKENGLPLSKIKVPTGRSPFKVIRESTNYFVPVQIPDQPLLTGDRSAENFTLLLEVRSTLAPGEVLDKCPRCSSPARMFKQPRHAVCSRRTCGFDYCTGCRCDFANHRPCNSEYVPRMPPAPTQPGAAKRNLRRLLL